MKITKRPATMLPKIIIHRKGLELVVSLRQAVASNAHPRCI